MTAVDVIFSTFQDIGVVLLYGWPFILLVYLWVLKLKWKKWPLEAVIIERRGNNLIKTNDRVGKFNDKFTGLIGYKLMKSGDTIPILNFDWILHNVAVHTNIFERFINLLRGNVGTMFLFKYGTKQYKPVWIKKREGRKMFLKLIKDKSGYPVVVNVYEQFDPRKHLGALEFVVIDWDNHNFMVQEQRASFERRQKEKGFWKEVAIPLIIVAVVALVCIIMIKFSYDWAVGMRGTVPKESGSSIPDIPVVNELIPAG